MRAAVLGHPIAHSLSPILHSAAYDALGLADWSYERVDVTEDRLEAFLASLGPEWAGLSLTMPLKVAAVGLATTHAPVVAATGVANTLLLSGGQRHAENTDVAGVLGALRGAQVLQVRTGAIVGAGATARSAAWALAVMGAQTLDVLVRRPGAAAALADVVPDCQITERRLGDPAAAESLSHADAVVSTVPDAATADLCRNLPGALAGALLDVVYEPWPTSLAQAWSARGGAVIPGVEMLLHQAIPQVEMMTGRDLDSQARDRMREALRQHGAST
jgi:shikimate dehydrogenase